MTTSVRRTSSLGDDMGALLGTSGNTGGGTLPESNPLCFLAEVWRLYLK